MLNELTIFQKTYELLTYLYPVLKKFPKSEKYTLAQRIENTIINLIEQIITLNLEKNKEEPLKKADIELEKLRIFTRLSHDQKFIGIHQYEIINTKTAEIGKMIGGLKKRQTDRIKSNIINSN